MNLFDGSSGSISDTCQSNPNWYSRKRSRHSLSTIDLFNIVLLDSPPEDHPADDWVVCWACPSSECRKSITNNFRDRHSDCDELDGAFGLATFSRELDQKLARKAVTHPVLGWHSSDTVVEALPLRFAQFVSLQYPCHRSPLVSSSKDEIKLGT